MTVSYAPLPLLATTGRTCVQSLTITALQEDQTFAPLDLSDYANIRFLAGDLSLSETDDENAVGIYRLDDAGGLLQIRLSAEMVDGFTLADGLDYTAFDWSLVGIYGGDTDLTELGSGELRISAGVGQ